MGKLTKVVVTGLLKIENKVLVIQRSKAEEFLPGIWELPGGKIKFGENLSDGLQREFEEEVGLQVKVGKPFFTFDYVSSRNNLEIHTVEVLFLVSSEKEAKVILSKDHTEYKWLEKKEVDLIKGPIKEAILLVLGWE